VFAGRLAELSTHPFLSLGEDQVELSLGGVQEKALVVLDGDRVGLPLHGAASTHIVKPDISDRLRSVLAEHYALRLASLCGVAVARSRLLRVDSRLVLFVERFDRLVDSSGRVVREHHETLAQALGVSPERKYEHRGGPGFLQIEELLRCESSAVVKDLQAFARLILFNTIIGNADAHAGNFGLLLYSNGAVRLASAYDLVPVRAVLGKDPKGYAMQIGGSYGFGKLTEQAVRMLATQLGLGPASLVRLWNDLREQVAAAVPQVTAEISSKHVLDDGETQQVELIARDILGRC
jgi:serine/threonine-protein kinase HipA